MTKYRRMDAVFGAALVLAYLDITSLYVNGSFVWQGAMLTCALMLFGAAILGAGLVGFDRLRARLRELTAGRRWVELGVVASASTVLTSLMLVVLARGLYFDPGVVHAATLGVWLGLAGGIFHLARRVDRPWTFFASAVACAAILWYAQSSIHLHRRISSDELDAPWMLLIVAVVGTAAFAFFVERLLAVDEDTRLSAWLCAPALAGSIVGTMLAIRFVPPNYEPIRNAAFVCSFLLAVLAFSWRPIPVPKGARYTLMALSLAGVVYLAAFISPFERSYVYLAGNHLSGEIIARTGLLRRASSKLIDESRGITRGGCWGGEERFADVPPVDPRFVDDWSVLLISVDTLRYDHMGYSGEAREGATPNLDDLARDSQRYHRAYPQGGWTSLSIPSVFWSRYPGDIQFAPLYESTDFELYLEDELTPGVTLQHVFQTPIEEPHPSMTELLSERGIATVAVPNDGHTKYFEPGLGFTRGFDEVHYPEDQLEQRRGAHVVDDKIATELALEALDERAHGDEQFFMWLHYFSPHKPIIAHDGVDFVGYAGEVAYVDRQVGRVLAKLRHSGLARRTVVVFLSDHGEAFEEHGYSGHGLTLHEPGLRVPLLIHVPGLPGRDYADEVGLIDVAPSILELMGEEIPSSMQGASQAGRWTREEEMDTGPVFFETWRYRGATEAKDIHDIGVVYDRHKVIFDLRKYTFSFYDLREDPEEKRPYVASGAPEDTEVYRRLICELAGWYDL